MKIHDILTEQETPVQPYSTGIGAPSPVTSGSAAGSISSAMQQGASTGVGQSVAVEPRAAQPVTLNFGPTTGSFTYEKLGNTWIEATTKKPVHPTFQQLLNFLNNKNSFNLVKTDAGWRNAETKQPMDDQVSNWLNRMVTVKQDQISKPDSVRQEPDLGAMPVQTDLGTVQIDDIKSAMAAMSPADVKRIRDAISSKLQGNT